MKKKAHRNKQAIPEKRCVFCGGKGLTKQHVLSNWINREFPDSSDSHHRNPIEYHFDSDAAYAFPNPHDKQGPLGSSKIRNVCKNCNGGWMSRLEQKSKPFLIDLFKGRTIELTREVQEAIVPWVTLTTIMFEFTQVTMAATRLSDRSYFKDNGIPSKFWEIWVAKRAEPGGTKRLRHASSCVKKRGCDDGDRRANFQGTIIQVEQAIFLSKCSFSPDIHFQDSKIVDEKFLRIWPLNTKHNLQPLNEVSTSELDIIFSKWSPGELQATISA